MSIKELSTDDLLKLAEAKEDGRKNNKPPKKEYKSVLCFIKDKQIMSGIDRVPPAVIYYEYRRNYDRFPATGKVKRVAFFHTFSKYFTQVRSNGKRYYLIKNFVEMTEEYMGRVKNHVRRT